MASQRKLRAAYEAGRTGLMPDGTAIDPCYPDYLQSDHERMVFWEGDAKAMRDYEASLLVPVAPLMSAAEQGFSEDYPEQREEEEWEVENFHLQTN
jgi:hypothetical protein